MITASKLSMYLTWFVWFINVVVLSMIMFNLLIAIVG